MVTHWKGWGGPLAEVVIMMMAVVALSLVTASPRGLCFFVSGPPSSSDLYHLPRGGACQVRKAHGRDGGVGRLHSCTPAPVSKVIFGCPLLLWVSRNRRMNQPMEEEKTSSSLFSYEEGEAV